MLAIFTPNIKIYVSQDIRHDQQQLIGSDVALTCDLVEEYGNQVKWRKFNGRLNEESKIIEGVLYISKLGEEDSGAYECYTSDGNFKQVHLIARSESDFQAINDESLNEAEEVDQNQKNDFDENRILECDFTEMKCRNGQCVRREHFCDGRVDCSDGSDEESCGEMIRPAQTQFCGINEATCRNGQCIPRSGLCDGRRDCTDNTDEDNCGGGTDGKCEPNEKPCRSDGKCIQKIWFCDGEPDCDDGSDEECSDAVSNGMCKSTEISCRDKLQCVLKSFLCDKENDCRDRSDEIGCTKPTISHHLLRNLTVVLGGTFRIQCKAVGWPHPYINWRLNWGHVCEEPRCFATQSNGCGILTVTDARAYDAGAYSCEAINTEGRVFAVPDTIVEVVDSSHGPVKTPSVQDCEPSPVIQTTTVPPPTSDCSCHNHSEDCTCSGRCLHCEHNTMGYSCEQCKPGFSGDATKGTPFDCLPTGQTTTTMPPPPPEIKTSDCDCNNHTLDCTCSGHCLNCQHNTYGRKCDLCKPGFIGDATKGTPHDCLPENGVKCNPYGTKSSTDKTCRCKRGVTGTLCDKCKPNYFNFLNDMNHKKGCLSCFCNGLSVSCKSSQYHYEPIESDFEAEFTDWHVSNKFTKIFRDVELNENGISFSEFNDEELNNEELYFIVPSKFKGDKLHSYGGNLTFKFGFTSKDNAAVQNLELRLAGSNINIFHVYPHQIIPNEDNNIVIHLHEDDFKRYGDNGIIKKEFMLLALSDIDLIMIKAKVSAFQSSVTLKDFTIDFAEDKADSNSALACKHIEICDCPEGYTGTSCESCASGYKRSNQGFYWGLCEPEF